MIEITLTGVQIGVGSSPDGSVKVLKFVDASGIVVTVPLNIEAARAVGMQLTSSVLVANGPLITREDHKQ